MINFQEAVKWWCIQCHGLERTDNPMERTLRFMEESIELAQAVRLPKEKLIELIEYVYSRPEGQTEQEIGGVMVTLAAFCNAFGFDLEIAGDTELRRIWDHMDRIREKQKFKIAARIGE